MASIPRFTASGRLSQSFQSNLGHWIAHDVRPFPTEIHGSDARRSLRDPDHHTQEIIRSLESRCRAIGVYPELFPAAAYAVSGIAGRRCADLRKAVRPAEARDTARCLSAFARTMVQRDPNQALYHLLLAHAFVQESKIAWQVPPDFNAIREALTRASAKPTSR